MSESSTVDQLQSPHWNPIYHQEILFATDQMKHNVFKPGEFPIKEHHLANLGIDAQENINYFGKDTDEVKARKKLNPFLYGFFPIEPLIPDNSLQSQTP